MSHSKTILTVALVGMLLIGTVAPVAAHSWQTNVTQGEMELGISSTPETPVAGMEAEFSGRIMDNGSIEGEDERLSWGGVTNKTVEVHINGPGDVHDHVKTEVPEDDAHFQFGYRFPEAGTYTITVVTTIEGDEYAFEFQRDVRLLPARAEGETVDNINENVSDLSNDVAEMQDKMDTIEQQNEELKQQNAELKTEIQDLKAAQEQSEQDGNQEASIANAPGFGFMAVLVFLVGGVAFVIGRRN